VKKSRYSDEQIVKILREADRDPVPEVAKRHGVSEASIYAWRKRFGEMATTTSNACGHWRPKTQGSKSSSPSAISRSGLCQEIAVKKW
jgi:putative transposase